MLAAPDQRGKTGGTTGDVIRICRKLLHFRAIRDLASVDDAFNTPDRTVVPMHIQPQLSELVGKTAIDALCAGRYGEGKQCQRSRWHEKRPLVYHARTMADVGQENRNLR